MPLFRFHKGSLDESLRTTVTIKNVVELMRLLVKHNWEYDHIEIEPYPDGQNCFDPRCGWYTHIVICIKDNVRLPAGFLSEGMIDNFTIRSSKNVSN